jgi:hypothetical protein
MGLGELEVYVSASKPGFARAIPLETPALYLGEDVARADTLEARNALVRAAADVKLRSGGLDEMKPADLASWFAAAIRVAGADVGRVPSLAGLPQSRVEERAKVLGKSMSRKDRSKALPAAVARIDVLADVGAFHVAARATARRIALLVVGDLHAALAPFGRSAGDPVAADLLAFGLGEDILRLRKELRL